MDVEKAVLIVEKLLANSIPDKNISDIQELVLRQCWASLSYQKIADRSGYDHDYIKHIGAKLWKEISQATNQKVTKGNIRSVLKQYCPEQKNKLNSSSTIASQSIQDWGDAIDVDTFFGRDSEINQCKNWLVEEHCRLITILGMGGVGKTATVSKLAREIAGEFQYVIWRSLRNAPPFIELLTDLILFISGQEVINLPDSIDACLDVLMKYLSTSHCLLILDNAESILQSGKTGGKYRQGYEGYGQLFRRIADESHQSCLIITSREQPKGIANRVGFNRVRSLQLSGLSLTAAQEILKVKGVADSQQLIEQYAGNPLALKIAATTIKSLFAGNIGEFLIEGTIVFGDIWDLLEQQFDRLSQLEQAVMYWLAINREGIDLSDLKQDVFPVISSRKLLETLESLQKRSLIEANLFGFTQQPVVMEYVTEKIIDVFEAEISSNKINLLQTHPMIKAESQDYLRETQVRLILQPIAEKLLVKLEGKTQITQRLQNILEQLRGKNAIEAGYAGGNILNLLKHLEVDLTGWDFSKLQIWQADLRKIKLQGVNFAYADLAKSIFTEKMGSILAVEFSPDGKLLATGDDNRIKIWQMPECKHIMTLPGHETPPVWSLAFSADGQILASGSTGRHIKLWHLATGKCLKILSGHQASIWSLAFSSDGRTLASASGDDSIKLWNLETKQEIASLSVKNSPMMDTLCFSPDGSLLATRTQQAGVQIWQISSLQCIQTIPQHPSQNVPIAFSPDGQLLAVGFLGAAIKLWHIKRQVWELTLPAKNIQLVGLRFSKDGQTIAGASTDFKIRLWQLSEGRYTKVLQGHRSRVTSISLAPDNRTLVSGSEDGSFKIWDMKTGRCLRTLSGYSDRVWSVAFSFNNKTLASANETGVIRLWNLHTGNYQELEHLGRVSSIAFSPDGKLLASINYNYQIKLWNLQNYRCLKTIQGSSNWGWSIAFSLNSQNLITAGGARLIYSWDANTGKLINTLKGHQDLTLDAVFLDDNETVATTSSDKTIKIWNIVTGECLQGFPHQSGVWSIAYNRVKRILATGSENGEVNLWHLPTGKCFASLEGHTQIVLSLDFSTDGNFVASSSNDRTIKLWDIITGQCVKTLTGHQDSVFGVAFSPQSNLLASGSHDETVKLWNIQTGECLQIFKAPNMYEGMNIKGVTGVTEAQQFMLETLGSIK